MGKQTKSNPKFVKNWESEQIFEIPIIVIIIWNARTPLYSWESERHDNHPKIYLRCFSLILVLV